MRSYTAHPAVFKWLNISCDAHVGNSGLNLVSKNIFHNVLSFLHYSLNKAQKLVTVVAASFCFSLTSSVTLPHFTFNYSHGNWFMVPSRDTGMSWPTRSQAYLYASSCADALLWRQRHLNNNDQSHGVNDFVSVSFHSLKAFDSLIIMSRMTHFLFARTTLVT